MFGGRLVEYNGGAFKLVRLTIVVFKLDWPEPIGDVATAPVVFGGQLVEYDGGAFKLVRLTIVVFAAVFC